MIESLPVVYLARHGETAWSLSGRHRSLTDLPLTERGESNARRLGNHLRGRSFARLFASPLQRARRTCELAGFGAEVTVDSDLLEWNYSEYEGLRTQDIHANRPDWQMFRDGSPGGESPPQVGLRADRVAKRVRITQARGKVLDQRIIPELESEAEPRLKQDNSTNSLISRYRGLKETSQR